MRKRLTGSLTQATIFFDNMGLEVMWLLIFIFSFHGGAEIRYNDANGRGWVYSNREKCEAEGHAMVPSMLKEMNEKHGGKADSASSACIRLPPPAERL
jgi:hypothetical protein